MPDPDLEGKVISVLDDLRDVIKTSNYETVVDDDISFYQREFTIPLVNYKGYLEPIKIIYRMVEAFGGDATGGNPWLIEAGAESQENEVDITIVILGIYLSGELSLDWDKLTYDLLDATIHEVAHLWRKETYAQTDPEGKLLLDPEGLIQSHGWRPQYSIQTDLAWKRQDGDYYYKDKNEIVRRVPHKYVKRYKNKSPDPNAYLKLPQELDANFNTIIYFAHRFKKKKGRWPYFNELKLLSRDYVHPYFEDQTLKRKLIKRLHREGIPILV